ncbi:hypothetical protein [Shinella sp.]|uniref:hypothetical protein n=2 Tax=Shinella sp. TaxID=1870904 RepID=UPI004035D8C0
MTDKTDGLLAQHHLLLAIIHTEWATRLDHKVAAVIIERYFGKFGNARASLRYLAERTKATRPNIIASVRRLTDRGAFSVIREGVGTRPTEYALNFGFFASGIAGDTSTSGIVHDTSCGIADDTSRGSSGIAGDTETYLPKPADKPVLQVSRNVDTPDPLPSDGLAATAAGSRDPFEGFWNAFPRKYQKPKARSAWSNLAPDVSTAERIIAAASAWAAHYEKHPIDKKWMPTPANWLSGERFDEDLPEIYSDPKEAAIARRTTKATSEPENTEEPAVEWCGEISPFVPSGTHRIKVTAASTIADGDGELLSLVLDIDDGGSLLTGISHTFPIRAGDHAVQERGQANLRVISSGHTSDDVLDLVGSKCRMCVGKDGRVTYLPSVHNALPGLAGRIKAARAAGAFSGERAAA